MTTWPPDNYADSLRRRDPSLHRRFVRQHGMNVTLRTLLREFEFGTTYARGERLHSRGVATAHAGDGRAVVYRRSAKAQMTSASEAERVSA